MKARRGVSLVELLVVMTACTALLTTSAVVLHRMMHAQTKTRDFLAVQRNSLRLSEQFRSDVHRAKSAATDDLAAGTVVRLQLDESQTVEYRHSEGTVQRGLLDNDEIVAREEFAFASGSKLAISREEPDLLTLSVTREPDDPGGPALQAFATPVHLRIAARLGGDRRHAEAPKVNEEASP